MNIEFEATFTPIDKDAMRARLQFAGAVLIYPEFLMKRVPFKMPELFRGWARVREEADKITMSYKKVTGTGIADQHEIETCCSPPRPCKILE